jgi:hypothetical protein
MAPMFARIGIMRALIVNHPAATLVLMAASQRALRLGAMPLEFVAAAVPISGVSGNVHIKNGLIRLRPDLRFHLVGLTRR